MTRNWANDIREGAMEERGFQRYLGEGEREGSPAATDLTIPIVLKRLLEMSASLNF